MNRNPINNRPLTVKQALKYAKEQFKEEHYCKRLPANYMWSLHPRNSGGRYILISGGKGLTTEFYFD